MSFYVMNTHEELLEYILKILLKIIKLLLLKLRKNYIIFITIIL